MLLEEVVELDDRGGWKTSKNDLPHASRILFFIRLRHRLQHLLQLKCHQVTHGEQSLAILRRKRCGCTESPPSSRNVSFSSRLTLQWLDESTSGREELLSLLLELRYVPLRRVAEVTWIFDMPLARTARLLTIVVTLIHIFKFSIICSGF